MNKPEYVIIDTKETKILKSENYNFVFNKKNGYFSRWGKTEDEDPDFCPWGPEILDIEVSTICNGIPNKQGIESPCSFCYKSNTKVGKNMTLDTFKKILDNMPKTLTQIAFGADATGLSNPDLFDMMDYCREKDVVPNITVANITDETADKLAKYCGAVAVSRYANKDVCYDSVKRLTDRGMTQVNIHFCIMESTFEQAIETFEDTKMDSRLEKLNAVVLLSLKQAGRGVKYNTLSPEKFETLVQYALQNKINIGFDSCSAYKFLNAVKDHPNFELFKPLSESCESNLFSSFIDVNGFFSACSFTPNCSFRLDAVNNKFVDLWNSPETQGWRTRLLNTAKNNCLGCRECPIYKI